MSREEVQSSFEDTLSGFAATSVVTSEGEAQEASIGKSGKEQSTGEGSGVRRGESDETAANDDAVAAIGGSGEWIEEVPMMTASASFDDDEEDDERGKPSALCVEPRERMKMYYKLLCAT